MAVALQQTYAKGFGEKIPILKMKKPNIKTLELPLPTSDVLQCTGNTGCLSVLSGIYLLQSSYVSNNAGT